MRINKDDGFFLRITLNERERTGLNLKTKYVEIDRDNKEINLCYSDFGICEPSFLKGDDFNNFVSKLNQINKDKVVFL